MQRTRILFLLGAALAFPATVAAQETQAPGQTQTEQAEPAAPADEETQIRQRIAALQRQARQDSAVQAASERYEAEVRQAMLELDSTAAPKMARASHIQTEAAAAREAGDNAKLADLAEEARTLQGFFAELAERARALPAMQEKRQEYLNVLFEKMKEIDPQAQALVDRLNELRSAGTQPAASGSDQP